MVNQGSVLWMLAVLVASGLAFAQEPLVTMSMSAAPSDSIIRLAIEQPCPKVAAPTAGKEFWALVITDKALKVWDIELTQRLLKQGYTEMNPLLPKRPTRARMYVQFMGLSVGADYLAYRLRRAGHPRWAQVIQYGSIGVSILAIQHNYRLPSAAVH